MTCTSCPLYANALTVCVQGKNNGKILFVLESPSGEDDLEGSYQESSRTGRLLSRLYSDAGLQESDVSIGYALRCRTSKATGIRNADIEACRHFLREQIRDLQPTLIIAMGGSALRSLCKIQGIKEKRGTEIRLHSEFEFNCSVFPTYGIEDLLRVPTYKNTIISDIRRACNDYKRVTQYKPEKLDAGGSVHFTVFNPMDGLPSADCYAWDGEWATGGKIVDYFTMLSCSDGTRNYVAVDPDGIKAMLLQLQALRESNALLVSHNGWSADLKIARNWGIEMPYGDDTMCMAYLDDETQPLNLQSLAVKYLGVPGWKHDNWETFDPNSLEAQQYAARDALYTYQLHSVLSQRLGGRMAAMREILRPAREALDRQTARGIWINPQPVAEERALAEQQRAESLAVLKGFAGASFKPGSPKQVGKYLTKSGIKLPETNSGAVSTSIGVLQSIDNEFCRELVRYRSAVKTLSTYVVPYERIIATGDGRVHPEYTLLRTLTGRSSARNLNIQNLDRDLKGFFYAPPGHTFISVDFGAIEFRIAAWFARERVILEQYAADRNWDPHRFVAAMFYGKPVHEVTKAERQIAKSANFGLLYLSSALGLQAYANKSGVEMSLTTAVEMRNFWHETFPGFRRFYQEVKDELKRTSEVTCPTGHTRHFGDFSLLSRFHQAEALRQAVNCKVQNFAAHLAYICMAELENQNIPCVGFIHDAFLFDYSPNRSFDRDRRIIEDILVNHPKKFLAEKFNVDFDIPLAVEFEVKHNAG